MLSGGASKVEEAGGAEARKDHEEAGARPALWEPGAGGGAGRGVGRRGCGLRAGVRMTSALRKPV